MSKKTPMTGAEHLTAWIEDGMINLDRLARRLGVRRQAINYWITGRNSPSRSTARKLDEVSNGAVPHHVW